MFPTVVRIENFKMSTEWIFDVLDHVPEIMDELIHRPFLPGERDEDRWAEISSLEDEINELEVELTWRFERLG